MIVPKSSSFFNGAQAKELTFGELNVPSKKAYVWFFAIEQGCDMINEIMDILPGDAINPGDISESVWELMFERISAHLKGATFRYFEVPVQEIQSLIMTNNQSIKDDYASWADYAKSYCSHGIESHPETDRFPCISFSGDSDIIWDGWHRLHSYINSNHPTIPVLEC
jgi:hypothetical protein